ncbi:hypothetical protein [Pseudomonas sp. ABFPK]|uniref:hypothetical protein n=1 Tax=Pseudomonas sp. ABFPK TaxID=1636605 RepID=UPI0012E77077|nr:hypothetical protein [Pseudomonas sp. ABFPK]
MNLRSGVDQELSPPAVKQEGGSCAWVDRPVGKSKKTGAHRYPRFRQSHNRHQPFPASEVSISPIHTELLILEASIGNNRIMDIDGTIKKMRKGSGFTRERARTGKTTTAPTPRDLFDQPPGIPEFSTHITQTY